MRLAERAAPPLRLPAIVFAATAAALFVAVGGLGVYRYLDNYWLYRGFPPPQDPAFVAAKGTVESFRLGSPALGGRRQQVVVYLPPGYRTDTTRRYPVFYLLHGVPGRPRAFLETVRAGVVQDIYLAKHLGGPMILVMPSGSTGTFTDEEWANGVRKHDGWETFVARDLVRAIDARYRTIPTGAGRAIGGLSEGGYGALNIALHHPREFHVIESWSGYQRADNLRSIFGGKPALLARNSPLDTLGRAARTLRREHAFVWFYSGTKDPFNVQNAAFARLLARDRIQHRYFLVRGGHNWAIWRGEAMNAMLAATTHLGHA
jgi:enterochelin esterase-like enzyme